MTSLTSLAGRGTLSVALVVFLLAVCVAGAAPAPAEAGCRSLDHQAQVCGQSVAPDQVPLATPVARIVVAEPLSTTWAPLPAPAVTAFQAHAAASAPRAPPRS